VVVNRRWISSHWIVISQSSFIYATRIIDKVHTGSLDYVLFASNVLFGPRASMAACELGNYLSSDNEFSKDELKADVFNCLVWPCTQCNISSQKIITVLIIYLVCFVPLSPTCFGNTNINRDYD